MKLERYKDKKETRKKVVLVGLTVVTLVSVAMMLYKTFAKFTTSTSFQIMSGKVVYKKKILDFGTDIAPGESGDGELYKVEHGGDSGWQKAELRYGGKNPNNYVYFNCDAGEESASTCELWRIIGLVNVQTNSGVEQRLKIIRKDSIGNYVWRHGYFVDDINKWEDSDLKKTLNDGYYNSSNNYYCYSSSITSTSVCNFSGTNPKGLREKARDMIDYNIVWYILGSKEDGADAFATLDDYMTVEGTWGCYLDTRGGTWSSSNDNAYFKSVGLVSLVDYGYATGVDDRTSCLKNTPLSTYQNNGCSSNNWLKPNATTWTMGLYHDNHENQALCIENLGRSFGKAVDSTFATFPCVYLKDSFTLTGGDGSLDTPYYLIAKN